MSSAVSINNKASRLLTKSQKKCLRPLRELFLTLTGTRSLPQLATIYHTDKWNAHWYAQHYERHLGGFRKRSHFNLLEIGIGGNENPEEGGNSLRMWKRYFPRANIYGLDLFDKKAHEQHRIKTFRGSQNDIVCLQNLAKEIGVLDVIIDDGSHQNEHVLTTFNVLFPLLAEGGVYAVEDAQTSYWPEYGGNNVDLNRTDTIVGYFKSLIDGLNLQEMRNSNRPRSALDEAITAVHFYHSLIFIEKGKNDELSYRY